jgi:hypothetical protein
MKLSGHSYDNEVFDSLLDQLKGDVILKSSEKKERDVPITGMDVFSSTTEDTLQQIRDEDLAFMAAELEFAASRAKVAVTRDDLAGFAREAKSAGLRGKKLERFAQKFCNDLQRQVAPPQGAMHAGGELNPRGIIPAGYPTEHGGPTDRQTGKFMGCSKNPNTIWDSEILQDMAKTAEKRQDMYGDEQIKLSQTADKAFRKGMKDAEWSEKQELLSDPHMLHDGIQNISTGKEAGTSQALPKNAMSMFDEDRDFSKIPGLTEGEKLGDDAAARALKAKEARQADQGIKGTTKANNSLDGLFVTAQRQDGIERSLDRAATDKLFDGLIDVINKKR